MENAKKVEHSVDEEPGGSKKELPIDSQKEEPGGQTQESFIEQNWQTSSKNAIRSIDDLVTFYPALKDDRTALKQVVRTFHMRIPHYYLSLVVNPADASDPIRRQCIPSVDEIQESVYEDIDPLGEEKTSPTPCLVHRYPDRALLLVTSRCFMYCRHCTRKRLWQKNIPEPSLKDLEISLTYVKENKQIREVVVSGGDPLTLGTERLDYILSSLSKIHSLEVIRIGTRAPVVLPSRIDESLCRTLDKYENLWINVQFNHPREVTEASISACKKLQRCGIPLSNQSVLLKGVNDSVEVMTELCHRLQSIRVRPYYLYQCDPVVGASHFRTSVWKGIELIEKMRGHTSGMCIPHFVVDGPEGRGKIPLGPQYLLSASDDMITLRNYKNEIFTYYNPKG